jgi:tartrate-resistant acid phosphatase type 5
MGKVGEELDIDFVVSTGDNFYENGLTGTDDQAFEQSFTDIYTAKSLQKPWYLGNKLLACAFRHSSSCCNVLSFVIRYCIHTCGSRFILSSSVLGNHDYRGDVLAQLSPVLQKIDSRFICMRSFIVNAGTESFLFPPLK